ncbi:unnamed protein product [Hymenolepis diminuta]|uniref:Uncharacterized protein n=1 Tax=Hymenolepis diminuta TaxID=6216 RepID=A0A564Y1D6_HYMDI|nr:unnamed protein product [Hymenolepis diminuta]
MSCCEKILNGTRLSTFPCSALCAKKAPETGTAVCVRDHRLNGIKGQKVSSELGKVACYIKWMPMANLDASSEPSPFPVGGKSSKLEMSPLDTILDALRFLLLGNSGTPEIQPDNKQNFRLPGSRKPHKRFQVDRTYENCDGK